MTAPTTTTPAVPHWDGPVWVVPIGGDCDLHGPYPVGSGCPDCARLLADTAAAPIVRITAGSAR